MADIAAELTNSLSRDGQGGMNVPFNFFDGSKNAPGVTFTNEPTAGFYRNSNGVLGISAQGINIGLFKAPQGNIETHAAAPIDDNDLTQKVWVEELVANAIAAVQEANWPVGSHYIGPDPNAVLPGSWTQMAEGTFLMNTVAGADSSGGDNDAVVVSHSHGAAGAHNHSASQAAHRHKVPTGNTSGNDDTIVDEGDNPNSTNVYVDYQQPAITVVGVGNHSHPAAGVSGVNKNKPLYKGVEVWERTV
jgi:hypothetical protein